MLNMFQSSFIFVLSTILIADLIRYGQFVETRLADEDLFSLRTLTKFRTYLEKSISDLKRKVVCILEQVFPEYQLIFSDIFGKTSKEILSQFPSPNQALFILFLAMCQNVIAQKGITDLIRFNTIKKNR